MAIDSVMDAGARGFAELDIAPRSIEEILPSMLIVTDRPEHVSQP
jgi:hypothetical protein